LSVFCSLPVEVAAAVKPNFNALFLSITYYYPPKFISQPPPFLH
jgi:hypothetical protein